MKNKKGFTLVELLAVIAILAILVIIALPNVIKMYNNAKKSSFLTEAKEVFGESEKKFISDSISSSSSNGIYCRSKTDSINPLDLSGRKINYYIKTDSSGNINAIVIWDEDRYVAKKGTKLEAESLDDALTITNDIKNATCGDILEKTGLEIKKTYNFTESDLIVDPYVTIKIKFSDSSDLSSLTSVRYRIYLQSTDDSDYEQETELTNAALISNDASNKFEVEITNPAKIYGTWDYTFRIEVYDNNDNIILEKTVKQHYCFVAGTKVLTEKGYVNIENIKIGDMVYSYNFNNNELELKKVINLINSEAKETYKMDIGTQTIEMSTRHELYIIDKGWTRAYDVKVGDKMLSSDDKVVTISKIYLVTYDEPIKTYNLTVEGNNNYFVTYSKVLVHNSPA